MEFFNVKELRGLKKQGVIIEDVKTVYITKDCIIEAGATIGRNVKITNGSLLKSGCNIKDYSMLSNVEIGSQTVVNHSWLTDCKIGENCQIGPFAHIKQNSILHNNIRVGNFVEIKNSVLKNGTKCAHLAYIGDAELGERVNVGCGVVFANYDGKKKHKTTIGNDVFIGCNCNLVAPLSIEDKTFIAAGTTVTKNLPENSFCIGRAREVIKTKKVSL